MYKSIIIILILISLTTMLHSEGQNDSSGDNTYEYNLDDFSGIDGSASFNIEVKKDNKFSVFIIADKSLKNKLIVEVRGNDLFLGMKPFSGFTDKTVKAIITMPELLNVDLSGASEMIAAGFESNDDFSCDLSGSSSLELDLIAEDFSFELSGSSNVYAVLEADFVSIELSGSSDIELYGRAESIDVEAQGTSTGNLRKFLVSSADIELSGSSDFYVNLNGTLNIDASGASTLYYTGDITLGDIDLSGASSIIEE